MSIDEFRDYLRDYYGTAMMSGFPMAVVDLGRIDSLSDEELIRIAENMGYHVEYE